MPPEENTDDLEVEQKDEEQVEETKEETQEETQEEESTEQSEESKEKTDDTDWKAEALKYKAIAERKAKQADKQKVQAKKPESNKQPDKIEITPLDTIALMEAEVTNTDDINEVLDYARFKDISVAKALKSNIVKTTIADKVAERQTAEATATKGGKKGVSTPDADTLIQQANEGNFPEDPADLARARMEQKKSKK